MLELVKNNNAHIECYLNPTTWVQETSSRCILKQLKHVLY